LANPKLNGDGIYLNAIPVLREMPEPRFGKQLKSLKLPVMNGLEGMPGAHPPSSLYLDEMSTVLEEGD
jgi:hypothetical protein